MIFQLPTKSDRTYGGKFPRRIFSVGYSQSPSQKAISHFLSIGRPVHVELNDGTRYIIDVNLINNQLPPLGAVDIDELINRPVVPELLSQARYDALLETVRAEREL